MHNRKVNNMQSLNVGRFSDRLASKIGTQAAATIYDYQTLDNGAIEGSFRRLKGYPDYRPVMAGFLCPNVEVRDYKEESTYKVMASNILMDPEDESLWKLSTSESGNKYLTRQGQEDLSELLSIARTRDPSIPTVASLASDVVNREYVAYVDPTEYKMLYGYGIPASAGTTEVVERNTGKSVIVSNALIVEIAALNDSDVFTEVAAPEDEKGMRDYYKEVYEYAPEYYSMLEEIIRNRATA